MNKITALCFLFFLLITSTTYGQEPEKKMSKIYGGYGLFLNYNLYCWYQKPIYLEGYSTVKPATVSSSGQAFNVLPGVGLNFWVGDVDHWIVSVEGAIEYMPFAIDLDQYRGLGALSIPVMAKVQFPVAKQQSLWLMMHVGAGAQLLKTNLYNEPIIIGGLGNPLFVSIIGEVGIHVSAVGYHRQHIREIEFFVRAGGFLQEVITFNTGLRLTFWNRIGKQK